MATPSQIELVKAAGRNAGLAAPQPTELQAKRIQVLLRSALAKTA